MNIVEHNRKAWDAEVAKGNPWTVPVSPEEILRAKAGEWSVLLTPKKPVPRAWFGDLAGRDLLCLASGGGQQGPIFAAAGARVTVFDNSPAQLAQDAMVASREGFSIRCEQGDMKDLSRFPDCSFDLIFHPVSNVFAESVLPVWKECARVLRPGGTLLAGFMNPAMYIFDLDEYDRSGRLEVRYRIPYSDVAQLPRDILEARIAADEPMEFGHSLADQIGGQLDAGLLLAGFYEDSWNGEGPLDAHMDSFIATRALKPQL